MPDYVDIPGARIAAKDLGGSPVVYGQKVLLYAVDGTTPLFTAPVALSDALANPTAPAVGAYTLVWDGTQWRRALAASLGDTMTNPSVPLVGAHGLLLDPVTGQYVRARAQNQGIASATPIGIAKVAPQIGNSAAQFGPMRAMESLGDANNGEQILAAGLLRYNGASYDRVRNTHEVTLLASGARTIPAASPVINTYNARSLLLWIQVSAVSGSPSIVPVVYGLTNTPAYAEIYLLVGAAITATGTYVYLIGPGLDDAARPGGVQKVANTPLPKSLYLYMVAGTADSVTYSAGLTLSV